jgi:transposase
LERRRRKAGTLFAKGIPQAEVARRCGVSREAARQWFVLWKHKSLASKGKPGPKPRLTEGKKKNIERVLLRGPISFGYETEIWTLERIATVVQRVTQVSYHPGHMWYILRQLNWSCQKPETKAKERDEQAIKSWHKTTWPRIKKRG